jgi:hypothetical protein
MSKQFLSEFSDVSSEYVKGLADKADKYKTLYEAGLMSQPEYVELLKDLKSQEVIADNAAAAAEKQLLNEVLNGLITAASVV